MCRFAIAERAHEFADKRFADFNELPNFSQPIQPDNTVLV
jgi:hypothetical protein